MFIGMFLFWGLLILAAIWLVRVLSDNRPAAFAVNSRSPLEILDERYARGEISKAERDQVASDLSR